MKLGLVAPRYGADVIGGTEHWLRTLLEHLVSMRGWEAEVFTTCATSAATWADDYPAGDAAVNGVTVHRFPSRSGRDARYLEMLPELRRDPAAMAPGQAARYLELVGPVCPEAVEAAVGSDCDLVAVTPFLYWLSVEAVSRLGRRVVFHGAAHDEPELRMTIMREVFGGVGGFSFNSYAERDLVYRSFRVGHLPGAVIGNAVVEEEGDQDLAMEVLGLEAGEPFVLCVGSVNRGKGSHILVRMWELYRRRHPGAPRLVLIGPVHEPVPAADGVVVAGQQPEPVKWGALRRCRLLVSPSAWESFSLVIIEAWLAGRPVVVNGRCGPTVEHCRRSGGGLWFDGYGDFEVMTEMLLADPDRCAELAARGGAYARREFGWDTVTERYAALVERIQVSFPARVAGPAVEVR